MNAFRIFTGVNLLAIDSSAFLYVNITQSWCKNGASVDSSVTLASFWVFKLLGSATTRCSPYWECSDGDSAFQVIVFQQRSTPCMPSPFLPHEVAQCIRIWFCLCYVYSRMNYKVLMLKTVELPHLGHDLNRPVPILSLVFELSSYLRNYLCLWVSAVIQIKIFFLKVHSSHFTNTIYWRAETLPK